MYTMKQLFFIRLRLINLKENKTFIPQFTNISQIQTTKVLLIKGILLGMSSTSSFIINVNKPLKHWENANEKLTLTYEQPLGPHYVHKLRSCYRVIFIEILIT